MTAFEIPKSSWNVIKISIHQLSMDGKRKNILMTFLFYIFFFRLRFGNSCHGEDVLSLATTNIILGASNISQNGIFQVCISLKTKFLYQIHCDILYSIKIAFHLLNTECLDRKLTHNVIEQLKSYIKYILYTSISYMAFKFNAMPTKFIDFCVFFFRIDIHFRVNGERCISINFDSNKTEILFCLSASKY